MNVPFTILEVSTVNFAYYCFFLVKLPHQLWATIRKCVLDSAINFVYLKKIMYLESFIICLDAKYLKNYNRA